VKRPFGPRAAAALIAIFSLLFAQLAISAFACPGGAAVPVAAPAMDMPGCDMAPAERGESPLCKAHCLQADSSIQKLAGATGMAAICAHPAAAPAWAAPPAAALAPERQGSLLERPTGPPLAVLHCRFLI
jgi:hypothetical protein